jgi:hypothetical protein
LAGRIQSGAAPEQIAALFGEDLDWDIAGDVRSLKNED